MVVDLVNNALGWSWTASDVFETGERIFNLKRLINALRHHRRGGYAARTAGTQFDQAAAQPATSPTCRA